MKKIVLIGSESTGKTMLAKLFAQKYNTVFVPEYAREYIENLDRNYNYNDVIHIAEKQLELEQYYLKKANKVLFYDTYLIITKVWLQHVFGYVPYWIEEHIKKSEVDLFLLCNNDLPWKYDKTRENPDLREYLFEKYKQELEKNKFNYRIVENVKEKRVKLAENFVNELF